MDRPRRPVVEPQCPLRPEDACSLCVPGATGPQDCPLVYQVMQDPDLRAEWVRLRREQRREAAARGERAAAGGPAAGDLRP